jgi:predicted TIM-barrel fold metal-dependent hydrolase
MTVDVHQHLWPPSFVAALRRRTTAPRLVGWRLELDGEPPYDVDPAHHDPATRAAQAGDDGLGTALVSMSAPLGVESLPAEEATPLLDAYHDGVLALPRPFGAWAAAGVGEPDAEALDRTLRRGFAGLQLPATALGQPADLERLGELLEVVERHGLPVLVHPGPARATRHAPGWWPAVVSYVQQLHAAWHAWQVAGRVNHPRLRVAFVALAGLAPLHHERLVARGGRFDRVDPNVFLDTSSYGTRAVDATIRVLGVDVLVHGSDRPYAEPSRLGLGATVDRALRVTNPRRLLDHPRREAA